MNTAKRDETYFAECVDDECDWKMRTKDIIARGRKARVHSIEYGHRVVMWDKVVYPTITPKPL